MKGYYLVKVNNDETSEYKGFSWGVKPTLDECTAGSTCFDCDTALTWTIDAEGEWTSNDKFYAPLPELSGSDDGKLLKVSDGAWATADAPTELPAVTSTDNGKALMVSEGAWGVGSIPTELPAVSGTDNGKALMVSEGVWGIGSIPAELPSVSGTDDGKVLTVASGVWSAQTPSGGFPTPTSSDVGKVLTVVSIPTEGATIVPQQTVTTDDMGIGYETLSGNGSLFVAGTSAMLTYSYSGGSGTATTTMTSVTGGVKATFTDDGKTIEIMYASPMPGEGEITLSSSIHEAEITVKMSAVSYTYGVDWVSGE